MSEKIKPNLESEEGFGCPECGMKPPYHHPTCSRTKKELTEKRTEEEKISLRTPEQKEALMPAEELTAEEPLAEVIDLKEYLKKRGAAQKVEKIKREEKTEKKRILDEIQNLAIQREVLQLAGNVTEGISYLFSRIQSRDLEKIKNELQKPYYQNLIKEISKLSVISEPYLREQSIKALWQEINNHFSKQKRLNGLRDPNLIQEFIDKVKSAIQEEIKNY
ncbi:MAG: hypothetical protein ACPLW9_02420 [Minisyncoccales bacterium]